jgi:very-short-patch-repair endonuclease
MAKIDTFLRDKIFLQLLQDEGLPYPVKEFHFDTARKWRFDFAFIEEKIAVEIEGGSYGRTVTCNHCNKPVYRIINGKKIMVREGMGHNTGKGSIEDMEKYNAAAQKGWLVLRFPSHEVNTKNTINTIRQTLFRNQVDYILNQQLF